MNLPAALPRIVGAKLPLRPMHVWTIRVRLQIDRRVRDLALFVGNPTDVVGVTPEEPRQQLGREPGITKHALGIVEPSTSHQVPDRGGRFVVVDHETRTSSPKSMERM